MPEITAARYRVDCTWSDIPHLTEKTKAELLASYPPHMRDARTQGLPSMGSGAVYPVPFEEIACAPFAIPAYWPRGYALDVGWKVTAAMWAAHDRENDCLYFYSEYGATQQVPVVHAAAIKARGAWINGCIDPASQGRSQRDGERLIDDYTGAGLRLIPADNAVEAGIFELWQRMVTGRAKFFTTLVKFREEYRYYRRDEKGKIIKENDHFCDDARYIAINFTKYFRVQPVRAEASEGNPAADSAAGY